MFPFGRKLLSPPPLLPAVPVLEPLQAEQQSQNLEVMHLCIGYIQIVQTC